MVDPDLKIKGGPSDPDPEIKGGPGLKKKFCLALWALFWSKNKGGPGSATDLDY